MDPLRSRPLQGDPMILSQIPLTRTCRECQREFTHSNPFVRTCDECWARQLSQLLQPTPPMTLKEAQHLEQTYMEKFPKLADSKLFFSFLFFLLLLLLPSLSWGQSKPDQGTITFAGNGGISIAPLYLSRWCLYGPREYHDLENPLISLTLTTPAAKVCWWMSGHKCWIQQWTHGIQAANELGETIWIVRFNPEPTFQLELRSQ